MITTYEQNNIDYSKLKALKTINSSKKKRKTVIEALRHVKATYQELDKFLKDEKKQLKTKPLRQIVGALNKALNYRINTINIIIPSLEAGDITESDYNFLISINEKALKCDEELKGILEGGLK